MPNRIIKESICTSESIDGLTWFEEVVFYRLIVNCDDYGRADARPALLKARMFPLKTVTEKQISDAIQSLRTAGIVCLYVVDGRPYLQLRTWDRHQTIRAKKSKFPPPEIGERQEENICKRMQADASKCPRNPIQSESNPNPNPKETEKDEEETRARVRENPEAEGDAERGEEPPPMLRDPDMALVVRHYEREMGRMLTPAQLESISARLTDTPADLICEAVNEAVRHDARSMAYVDTVLANWAADGVADIQTLALRREEIAKRKKGGARSGADRPGPDTGGSQLYGEYY